MCEDTNFGKTMNLKRKNLWNFERLGFGCPKDEKNGKAMKGKVIRTLT